MFLKMSGAVAVSLLCVRMVGTCLATDYCEIQVVDKETRRGVPMVELSTVDDVVYVSDSAGRIALREPELDGSTVFFKVQSPGYQIAKDGFGIEGVRLLIKADTSHVIEVTRINVAERLYRITGRDIYLDTVRLGYPSPIPGTSDAGQVVGQDSVQPVVFRNHLHWFWGDTNRLLYPLGLFRTAGAVSELPEKGGLDPSIGIDLKYYTNADGFARAMVEVPNPDGVVWIFGTCVVPDETGNETIVAHFSRRKSLAEPVEQGLVRWNPDRSMFEVLKALDLQESWRMLSDHPIHVVEDGVDYLCFGNPFPVTRVPATLTAVQDPNAYESLTCREDISGQHISPQQRSESKPVRDESGRLVWKWKKAPPVTQQDERRWLKQGLISIDEARFLPRDAESSDRVVEMHSGTVHWNEFRQRWVMVAIEHAWDKGSPSFLGEVFYSEASVPQGPFLKTLKIATHPKQSFYNPCHHPFFDQDGGRTIYFEGTYCNTFTTSPATPRYNYNQLMYRLDLGSGRIAAVFPR